MPANTTDKVIVEGKVVEIVEKDVKPTARVSVQSFYLDVPTVGVPEAHLGDSVVITLGLKLVAIANGFDQHLVD